MLHEDHVSDSILNTLEISWPLVMVYVLLRATYSAARVRNVCVRNRKPVFVWTQDLRCFISILSTKNFNSVWLCSMFLSFVVVRNILRTICLKPHSCYILHGCGRCMQAVDIFWRTSRPSLSAPSVKTVLWHCCSNGWFFRQTVSLALALILSKVLFSLWLRFRCGDDDLAERRRPRLICSMSMGMVLICAVCSNIGMGILRAQKAPEFSVFSSQHLNTSLLMNMRRNTYVVY